MVVDVNHGRDVINLAQLICLHLPLFHHAARVRIPSTTSTLLQFSVRLYTKFVIVLWKDENKYNKEPGLAH